MSQFLPRSRPALWGPVLILLASIPVPSLASSISSIEVLPAQPNTTDPTTLRVELSYETSGFSVGSFDIVFPDASDVRLDIFVDSPAPGDLVLPVIGSETVDASLGVLVESSYDYTVRLFEIPRGTSIPLLQEVESGSFVVVPEPATLLLVGTALLAFLGIKRPSSTTTVKLKTTGSGSS